MFIQSLNCPSNSKNAPKEAPKNSNIPTISGSRITNFSPYPLYTSNMTPIDAKSLDKNKLQIYDFNINSDTLKDISAQIEAHPYIDTIEGNNVTSIKCKLSELSKQAIGQIRALRFPNLQTICEGAFENTVIEAAYLPSLNVLPNNVFSGCEQLREVAIPAVTQIGNRAFYKCASLVAVYANNVKTIGSNVFDNSGVTSISMNALTSIGSQFGTCKKLYNIYLNSIGAVPSGIFRECPSLTKVEVREASVIQPYAFYGCPKLEVVHCSNAVKILQHAFESSGLQRIHMTNATLIETHAFAGCKNLQQIYWFGQSITSNYKKVHLAENHGEMTIDNEAFLGINQDLLTSIAEFSGNSCLYYPGIKPEFKETLHQYKFTPSSDQRFIIPFSEAYRLKNAMYRNMKFGLDLDGPQRDSIGILKNAIKHCTNAGSLKLYRGIKDVNTVLQMANQRFTGEADDIELLVEKVIFDRSFISTSISGTSASCYIKETAEDRTGILLVITVPEGTYTPLMPIANENDEVVLNQYQKLQISKVKYISDNVMEVHCNAISNNEDTQQIEKSIYNSNEFKNYQREFELRLGQYAYTHQRSYNVVHKAIEQIKRLNNIDDSGDNIAQHSEYVQAFFSNPQYMGVHIPGNTMDPNNTYLQAEQLKLMLKSEMPNGTFDSPGNLREKMAALQSSSPNNMQIRTLRTKEPKIDSTPRDEADQINFQRPANYQNRMGLNRSAREIYYQSIHRTNGMSPIISNETRLVPVACYNEQTCQIMGFFGKRLIAGTSETTKHLLTYFKSLGFRFDRDLLDFRLAIIGYTLPENNASLYEVLQASHEVGIHGTENVSTAETMDQTIDPLTEEELREHVCRDGLFPFELCLREMFPEIFARRIQQEISKNDPEQESKKGQR